MRLSRARKKHLSWFVGGVQDEAVAVAANTSERYILIDPAEVPRKYTLVRLLIWAHVVNTGTDYPGNMVFFRVGLEHQQNGAFAIDRPDDDDNVDGNRSTLLWEPIWLPPGDFTGANIPVATWHQGPLFRDIKSGRRIDSSVEQLVATFRASQGFSATVNYRALLAYD